jgi:hypothetical protein
MFPSQQLTGQGSSSPGAPRVPPTTRGKIPVIQSTSSVLIPYEQLPSAPGRPPMSIPTKRSQPALEPRRTDVPGYEDLPKLPEISYEKFDSAVEGDDLSDLGGAEGKASISLKQMEITLKQFAKRMGQPNFSAFNKWKNVWVAGFLKKNHWSIITGQNSWKQQRDGPLHWEMVVANCLDTFETWLLFENLVNAQ